MLCKGPWPPGMPSEEVAEQRGARNQGTMLAGVFKCLFASGEKFRGHRGGRHSLFLRHSEHPGQRDQNPAVAVGVIGLQGKTAPGAQGVRGGRCLDPLQEPLSLPREWRLTQKGSPRCVVGLGKNHREETQAEAQRPEQTCCVWRMACAWCAGLRCRARGRMVPDVAEQAGGNVRVLCTMVTRLDLVTKQ